jgi:ATPase subunit of ABC transporter with duplicated ATPase domains
VILGSLSFSAMAAELYKWVDENGVVHYSQTPPENAQTEEVEVQEQYPDTGPPAGASVYTELIEQQKKRRELEQQREAEEKANQDTRELEAARTVQDCARAIHALDTLRKQCPVFYDGAGFLRAACPRQAYSYYEGERTYVEDAERQELIAFYSAVVEKCGNE